METKQKERELKEKTLKKIDYLLSKEEIFDLELYLLVKKFFYDYLKIEEELSIEELIEKLKNIYIERETMNDIISFLREIEPIEYDDNPLEKEKVKKYLKDFARIVEELIPDENNHNHFEKRKVVKGEEASVEKVKELIEEIVKSIANLNHKEAKRKYLKAYELYNLLEEEEKAQIYNDLFEVYQRLKEM